VAVYARVLNRETVTADGARPDRWIHFLHGIFGAGRNWASVARRLVRARPGWGAVLVDLRGHGASQGFPPPHTVAACAEDLDALVRADGRRPTALLGHSFGGKVAMAYAAGAPAGLRQLWVVDSTPAVRPPGGSAWDMLGRVRALPDRFASRAALVAALTADGVAGPVAQWMATNLEGDPASGYRWRFDLDAIEALLRDFFTRDLWSVIETPPDDATVHVIRAQASDVLSGDALRRVEQAAGGGSRTRLHTVAGGHWVNAENPHALHALLAGNLA
jgi:esterase